MLRGFCQRLPAAGKPKKLALTACVHKLLTTLDGMVKSGKPWRPHTISSRHQR